MTNEPAVASYLNGLKIDIGGCIASLTAVASYNKADKISFYDHSSGRLFVRALNDIQKNDNIYRTLVHEVVHACKESYTSEIEQIKEWIMGENVETALFF